MTPWAQSIYEHSPPQLQSIALSWYGWRLRRIRHGRIYRSERNRLARKDWGDSESEYAYQTSELKRLIGYAVRRSKFYAERYGGLDLALIRSPAELPMLPILSKEDLRENMLLVRTIGPSKGVRAFTGGTTGKSLEVVFTKADFQKRMAYLDAFKVRSGVDPDAGRKATFSGRQFLPARDGRGVYWRTNWAYRQRLYSTFHLTPDTMDAYVDDLERWQPQQVNGFVSAISTIASHMLQSGRRLHHPPAAVFTTSESLLPFHREVIESAFECRVFDQYASAEGAPFVTECVYGQLHYHIDTGVIEPWEGPDGPEVLVTSFTSYGTPLIRYRIGDTMQIDGEGCACGSSHPVVRQIDGRAADYLLGEGGRRVSVSHLSDVVKGLPNAVKAMQFVQESRDAVRILVVPGEGADSGVLAEKIAATARYRFGNLSVELEFVPEIPTTSGGKRPFIRNLLSDARDI